MRAQNTPSVEVVPSGKGAPYPTTYQPAPLVYQSIGLQPTPYERPRPRIAKGIFVLLASGLAGLIVFAMGQTVWGAIWRGWIVTAVIVGILYVAL